MAKDGIGMDAIKIRDATDPEALRAARTVVQQLRPQFD